MQEVAVRTFTFGFAHTHPITGESLARHYIQVPGEDDLSRRFMNAVFGRNWSMQYRSPAEFKYPKNMVELEWTPDLVARISADDRDVLESVVGESLEKHFGVLEAAIAQARTEEIDKYFDLQKQLPEVTTITGEPEVEYAQSLPGGGMQTWKTGSVEEAIYPLGKRLLHTMRYGGRVYRRRILVVEDWTEVDESDPDINAALKAYSEHKVDLGKDIKLP